MMIAHLPAGYVISKSLWLRRSTVCQGINEQLFLTVGLIGSVAPDFDMLYFYLIDQRSNHHHLYVTHYPILWFSLLGMSSLLWLKFARIKKWAILGILFCLNGVVHLLLDSIVGDIWWLMPFIDQPYALFTVPARFSPWWLSFVFHWSFLFELLLVSVAIWLWRKTRNTVRVFEK